MHANSKHYPHTFGSAAEQWASVHQQREQLQLHKLRVEAPSPPTYPNVHKHMPRGLRACQCPKCRPSNYR